MVLLTFPTGCVPVQQQVAERERDKIEGFVAPLTIDVDEFYRRAPFYVYDKLTDDVAPFDDSNTYNGTFDGKAVYIRNCKCISGVSIVQNKLVLTHRYVGGTFNRESTSLLWNGKHVRDANGHYVVDLFLYSPQQDAGRMLIHEKKMLDIAPVQVKGAHVVWINLIGYDQFIEYKY